MTNRIFAAAAGLILLMGGAAAAQSRPGLAFDQVVHTTSDRDTANTTIHMTAAGSDVRLEVEKGSSGGPFSKLPIGDGGVIIFRKGGEEMILLNPGKREYTSIKPKEMLEASQKTLESIGASMRIDTSVSNTQVDSLGPGPLVDGHPTLRYRVTARLRMTLSMPDMQQTMDIQSISEIDAASDLSDFSDVVSSTNLFGEMMQSFSPGKDFVQKARNVQHKIRGMPIRSVSHRTQNANGIIVTITETTDTRNIRRVTAPDSAFAIPADYKLTSMPGIPPG